MFAEIIIEMVKKCGASFVYSSERSRLRETKIYNPYSTPALYGVPDGQKPTDCI